MSSEKKRIKEQVLINTAIASIKKQISDLEASKAKFVTAAAVARENGIASQYRLAINAIRIVTAQKTVVEQMLLNLQLSAQIKDVSQMTKTFADGMKLLSGSITETTSGLNFEKVGKQMDKAMMSTQLKQAESDVFLGATQSAFEGLSLSGGASDDEIERLISAEMTGLGDIDADIAALEKKLKGNSEA